MSRRDQIEMSPEEIRGFLDAQKTIILVSNGSGGYPHPMPMWFYHEPDGAIRMTTYAKSQKVLNLRRDPRVSLLAESGEVYQELRGVVLYGKAEVVEDLDLAIDTLLRGGGADLDAQDPETAERMRKAVVPQARKRVVIRVAPEHIVSWDHAKLGGVY